MPEPHREVAKRLARRGRVRSLAPDAPLEDVVRAMDRRSAAGLLHDGAALDAADIADLMGVTVVEVRQHVAKARLAAAEADCSPCLAHLDGLMTFAAESVTHAMECEDCSATREALRTGKVTLRDRWRRDETAPVRPWDDKATVARKTAGAGAPSLATSDTTSAITSGTSPSGSRGTPPRAAPVKTTPVKTAPVKTPAQNARSHKAAPQRTAPQRTGPHKAAPLKAAPLKAGPQETGPQDQQPRPQQTGAPRAQPEPAASSPTTSPDAQPDRDGPVYYDLVHPDLVDPDLSGPEPPRPGDAEPQERPVLPEGVRPISLPNRAPEPVPPAPQGRRRRLLRRRPWDGAPFAAVATALLAITMVAAVSASSGGQAQVALSGDGVQEAAPLTLVDQPAGPPTGGEEAIPADPEHLEALADEHRVLRLRDAHHADRRLQRLRSTGVLALSALNRGLVDAAPLGDVQSETTVTATAPRSQPTAPPVAAPTTPPPAPPPAPAPPTAAPTPEPVPEPAQISVATWHQLASCESSGDWTANTGNGFYGGLQFTLSSWEFVGGTGLPSDASPDEQMRRAQLLHDRQGWEAWPSCSRQLGLR